MILVSRKILITNDSIEEEVNTEEVISGQGTQEIQRSLILISNDDLFLEDGLSSCNNYIIPSEINVSSDLLTFLESPTLNDSITLKHLS